MNRLFKSKLFTLLMLLSLSCCMTVYAQGKIVTVNMNNASLKQVFNSIEKQTSFRFSYRDGAIDSRNDITLSKNNASISAVLDAAFQERNLNYSIVPPNSIVISDKQVVVTNSQAKKIAVSGVITDHFGEPIIGASVLIKGSTSGTISDLDGQFVLSAVSGAILQISYIGYKDQEVKVTSNRLMITLEEDTEMLNEVVVVGYGVMRKSDVTGSISQVKGAAMQKAQNFSALDNLRGKASGVNVYSNSSQPGAYASRVVIRGLSTINASSSPLYVVDGVVMENFGLVNPNDIESMEVLKDASATAIYGARGANGVVLVTTKRGNKFGEGTTVSYQGSMSVSTIARYMDLLNGQEWCDAFSSD